MNKSDNQSAVQQRHEQMLKLVSKGFYNELIKYGVNKPEILTVAGHLLDNLLHQTDLPAKSCDYYNQLFRIEDIRDQWNDGRRLCIHDISLTPLNPSLLPAVVSWLKNPAVREHFVQAFPISETEAEQYFQQSTRQYLCIHFQNQPAGIIGAENIDWEAGKLEMRKLVGNPVMHGKGIGKRATLLFLYYVFEILKLEKIYLYSTDVNIRNLNLNNKFGFELEGVFFEEAMIQGKKVDLVRMGLRASVWRALFS